MAFRSEYRKEMQWLLEYTHLPLNLHKIFDERLCKQAPLIGASD